MNCRSTPIDARISIVTLMRVALQFHPGEGLRAP